MSRFESSGAPLRQSTQRIRLRARIRLDAHAHTGWDYSRLRRATSNMNISTIDINFYIFRITSITRFARRYPKSIELRDILILQTKYFLENVIVVISEGRGYPVHRPRCVLEIDA